MGMTTHRTRAEVEALLREQASLMGQWAADAKTQRAREMYQAKTEAYRHSLALVESIEEEQ